MAHTDFFITENYVTEDDLKDINRLMWQLGLRLSQVTLPVVEQVMKDGYVFLARYEESGQRKRVIGMATLISVYSLEGYSGLLRDLIVDESYRGQKLGWLLMHHAMSKAKKLAMSSVAIENDLACEAAYEFFRSIPGCVPYRAKNFRFICS